ISSLRSRGAAVGLLTAPGGQTSVVQFVAVAVGAMLGANLRYVIMVWSIDQWGTDFPYGTLIVNVSGAFAIGIILAYLGGRLEITLLWRLLFRAGFRWRYTSLRWWCWRGGMLAAPGGV